MNIEDLLGSVGGDQMQRVLQIVRQVDDNWDGLMQAVDFITDHGDDLIDLLGRLPDILERAGEALGTAAEAAVEASSFLTAGDGLDADDIAGSAARAMAVCQEHLSSVAGLLDRVGEELGGIKVPTIDVERNELMGLSVVSGIDIGSNQVAGGAARDVKASARQLKDVADALATAGDGLGRLQSNLSAAGDRINALAGDVEASGNALAELSGGPSRRSTKKRNSTKRNSTKRKATSKKKPAAKRKPATRKAPAKKRSTTKRSTAKRKPTAKRKTTAKRSTATRKPAARKAPARKAAPTKKRAPAKKRATTPKRATTTKRAPATKRTTARRGQPPKLGQGVLKPRR